MVPEDWMPGRWGRERREDARCGERPWRWVVARYEGYVRRGFMEVRWMPITRSICRRSHRSRTGTTPLAGSLSRAFGGRLVSCGGVAKNIIVFR